MVRYQLQKKDTVYATDLKRQNLLPPNGDEPGTDSAVLQVVRVVCFSLVA